MSARAHAFIVVVTLSCLLLIVRLVRRRRLRAKYAMLWLSLGAVLVVLAAFPPILDKVSLWLGISYGPATFFLAAIVFLLVVAVHFSWELSRFQDRIQSLAEEIAFLRLELEERTMTERPKLEISLDETVGSAQSSERPANPTPR